MLLTGRSLWRVFSWNTLWPCTVDYLWAPYDLYRPSSPVLEEWAAPKPYARRAYQSVRRCMRAKRKRKQKKRGNLTRDVDACMSNASLPITWWIEMCTRSWRKGGRRRETIGAVSWGLDLGANLGVGANCFCLFLGYLLWVVLVLFCSSSFCIGHAISFKD